MSPNAGPDMTEMRGNLVGQLDVVVRDHNDYAKVIRMSLSWLSTISPHWSLSNASLATIVTKLGSATRNPASTTMPSSSLPLPTLSSAGSQALDALIKDAIEQDKLPATFLAAANAEKVIYENQGGYVDYPNKDRKVDGETSESKT